MNIPLDHSHRLTSDKHNYILEEKRIYEKGKDKGKIYWRQILFFPTLQQAVAGYCERFLRESELVTLEALSAAVAELRAIVEDVKGVCCG